MQYTPKIRNLAKRILVKHDFSIEI